MKSVNAFSSATHAQACMTIVVFSALFAKKKKELFNFHLIYILKNSINWTVLCLHLIY